ncbi:hypothetical protein KKC60_03620 [Patescibacteria group bacterium]|nr:hypothetical protein [Patescibacteria group bacterium]
MDPSNKMSKLRIKDLQKSSRRGGTEGKKARLVMSTLKSREGVLEAIKSKKKGISLSGAAKKKGTLNRALGEGDFKSKAEQKAYAKKLGGRISGYEKSMQDDSGSSDDGYQVGDKTRRKRAAKGRAELRGQFSSGLGNQDSGPTRDGIQGGMRSGVSSPRESSQNRPSRP